MLSNNKAAIIGDADSILAFKALGVDTFPAKSYFEVQNTLKLLARDYAVIFITEDIAESMQDLLLRYKTRPFPAVIPIPSAQGSSGFGMKGLARDVEKAIGADILFNKN